MRYFVPDIVPVDGINETRERLGGVPLGLHPDDWPHCADCNKSMTLLAQLAHHEERLDLGREGRMLLVFLCAHDPGMCDSWDAMSGANACLIVEPERLGECETPVPSDDPPTDPCVAIVGWLARDDGVSDVDAAHFFDEARWTALPDEIGCAPPQMTHLGGLPAWMQSPDEAPRPGWRFLGQLDSSYSFISLPNDPPPWVHPDPERFEGRSAWADGPNFGDGGVAYLFKKGDQVLMFWQ